MDEVLPRSPLHVAVGWRHFECAELLLEAGANPNVVDKEGEMPLHLACRYCYYYYYDVDQHHHYDHITIICFNTTFGSGFWQQLVLLKDDGKDVVVVVVVVVVVYDEEGVMQGPS